MILFIDYGKLMMLLDEKGIPKILLVAKEMLRMPLVENVKLMLLLENTMLECVS